MSVFLANLSLMPKCKTSKTLHFSIKMTIVAVIPHSGESDSKVTLTDTIHFMTRVLCVP